jgi:hypothetical protein
MFAHNDTIDVKLKQILLEEVLAKWDDTHTHFKSGGSVGGLRGHINVQENFSKSIVDSCNLEIKKIMTELGLNSYEFAYARHFLGVNTPGAWVPPHKDIIQFLSAPHDIDIEDFQEIRCNFYLQRPDAGGNPCQGDVILENSDNMGWIFNASKFHHSTPVIGNTNRIVMSLGSVVRIDKLKDLNLL